MRNSCCFLQIGIFTSDRERTSLLASSGINCSKVDVSKHELHIFYFHYVHFVTAGYRFPLNYSSGTCKQHFLEVFPWSHKNIENAFYSKPTCLCDFCKRLKKSYKISNCNTLSTPSVQKYEHAKRLQGNLTLG